MKREEIHPDDAKWVFEYDEMAEQYDKQIKEYSRWLGVDLNEEFRRVTDLIPMKSSQHILDVSTGTGATLFTIKDARASYCQN